MEGLWISNVQIQIIFVFDNFRFYSKETINMYKHNKEDLQIKPPFKVVSCELAIGKNGDNFPLIIQHIRY